jgi:putative hydrolase of HD superfamily
MDFLRRAESLKSTLRTTWTRTGRQESTAEHSWRLSLFSMLLSAYTPDLDPLRMLKMSIVHDLGEAISGDIPAPDQTGGKSEQERTDLIDLLRPLPQELRTEILALWEDYEHAKSPEARAVKALDKLETLLQQAAGANPPDFDYAFNLQYGMKHTLRHELFTRIREAVDMETQCCLIAKGVEKGGTSS